MYHHLKTTDQHCQGWGECDDDGDDDGDDGDDDDDDDDFEAKLRLFVPGHDEEF
jgi:hypothetical protein